MPDDRTRFDGTSSDPTRLDTSDVTRVDASDGWGVTTSLPSVLADRYEVVRALPAVGGEADLWVVRERAAGVLRVLKVYRVGVSPKVGVLERLGGALGEFVVQLFEHAVVGGRAFEVLEFVEFGSMRDAFPAGVVVGDEVLLRVVRALVDALSHVHDLGVVHRDLKPGNVLVRSMDPLRLVLADFGIASAADSTVHYATKKWTVAYAAPESLAGVVSAATDYWSLGMMIAELASGRHPWGGLDARVVEAQITTVAVPLSGVREPWLGLCEGLLQRDPRARWGRAEVRRYLAGDATLPRVRRGDSPRSSAVMVPAQVLSSVRPYKFEGVEYSSPVDLARAFVDKPAAAVRHLERGFVFRWLTDDVRDNDLAVAIHDVTDLNLTDENALVLRATAILAGGAFAGFAGRLVSRETLAAAAEGALRDDASDVQWLTRLCAAFGGWDSILVAVRAAVGGEKVNAIEDRLARATLRLRDADVGFQVAESVSIPMVEGFVGVVRGARVVVLAGAASAITPALVRAVRALDPVAAWLLPASTQVLDVHSVKVGDAPLDSWSLDEPLRAWGARVAAFDAAWRHEAFEALPYSMAEFDAWFLKARALLLQATLDDVHAEAIRTQARGWVNAAQRRFRITTPWSSVAVDDLVAATAFALRCAHVDPIMHRWEVTQALFATVAKATSGALEPIMQLGPSVAERTVQQGRTALHLAAESNPDPDVVRLLVRAGADVNAVSKDGFTPYQLAKKANAKPEVLQALADAGARTK